MSKVEQKLDPRVRNIWFCFCSASTTMLLTTTYSRTI